MKLGIPWRLRFALNDMGWVSRADLIWYKGKEYDDGTISKVAMPESARRETCSYEMVFRFTKTSKMNYYVHEKTGECRSRPPSKRVEGVDFEWVTHDACEGKGCDMARCHDGMVKSTFWHGYSEWLDLDAVRKPHTMKPQARLTSRPADGKDAGQAPHRKPQYRLRSEPDIEGHPAGANPGDVLIIQPEPFPLPHYACWPSALCEFMIKVGCPKEICPKCGKPRERITKVVYWDNKGNLIDKPTYPDDTREPGHLKTGMLGIGGAFGGDNLKRVATTIGWSDCGCGEGFIPGVVLDPFCGGSGRAARMARKLGRRFIGVDLKVDYLEMSRECYLQDEIEEVKEQIEMGARQEVLL